MLAEENQQRGNKEPAARCGSLSAPTSTGGCDTGYPQVQIYSRGFSAVGLCCVQRWGEQGGRRAPVDAKCALMNSFGVGFFGQNSLTSLTAWPPNQVSEV